MPLSKDLLCLRIQNLERVGMANAGGESNEVPETFIWRIRKRRVLFLEEHWLSVWHLQHDTNVRSLACKSLQRRCPSERFHHRTERFHHRTVPYIDDIFQNQEQWLGSIPCDVDITLAMSTFTVGAELTEV